MNLVRTTLSVALAGLVLGGCTPYLKVQSRMPGPVSVGGIQSLVVVDGEGRRSAREYVVQTAGSMVRQDGYFQLVDQSESGIKLAVSGGMATAESATEPLQDGQAYLQLDVLDWRADSETREEEYTENGQKRIRRVNVTLATAVVAATLVNHEGKALLAERDYEGRAESRATNASRDQVIEMAANNALRQLLSDITPVNVVTNVRIDDSDKALETYIKTARAGNVAQAQQDLWTFIQANPGSPAAYYNLGVFTEATGNFQQALEYYDEALKLGGTEKKFYQESRANCARRIADLDALKN